LTGKVASPWDSVASPHSSWSIEDRQRDVLEAHAKVGLAPEVEWLYVAFDRDRRELLELAFERDGSLRVRRRRQPRDRARKVLHVGCEIRLDEKVREVHPAALDPHLANADGQRLGSWRRRRRCSRRLARLACLGRSLVGHLLLALERAALGRGARGIRGSRCPSLGKCRCSPLGIEHRRDIDDLFLADDHAGIGLSQQHPVDAERIGRHRVGQRLQVQSFEIDEVLVQRVVRGAEAVDRHVAVE